MDILEELNQYCEAHSTPLHPHLDNLVKETYEKVPGAHMITGHVAGHFLSIISQMVKPKCVVELGTYTGFSAMCLATGLAEDGKIHTIDIDDRWQELRNKYWKLSGLHEKIVQHIGPGLKFLNELDIKPDLAFVDADKGNYSAYVDKLIEIMPSGAWIIVDNVLFRNEVLDSHKETPSKTAQHIISFNNKIISDERIEILMLPIRDGISVIKIK